MEQEYKDRVAFNNGTVDNYYRRRNRVIRERKKTAKIRVKKMRANPTKAEAIFKALLDKLMIRYTFQKAFISEWTYCIADFYLPNIDTVIEVDGSIHDRPDIRKKDRGHDKYHKNAGRRVIRLSNTEVYHMGKQELMRKLKR